MVDQFLEVGMASTTSLVMTWRRTTFCVSTTGLAPETVTVSSSVPTRSSGLMVATKVAGSSTFSRLTVANPGSVNVTVYTPGRRSTILYWPCVSVVTVRTCSMSAGLDASTVTPGITAPLGSLTTPAIPLVCANAMSGAAAPTARSKTNPDAILRIHPPDECGTSDGGSDYEERHRKYAAAVRASSHGAHILSGSCATIQNDEPGAAARRRPVDRGAVGRRRAVGDLYARCRTDSLRVLRAVPPAGRRRPVQPDHLRRRAATRAPDRPGHAIAVHAAVETRIARVCRR